MNYHHLRYFWMVAREGTLRQAADKMGVSQPSISAQLHLLEDALGERLLRKNGNRLVMTESGQLVYSFANEIFSIGQELLDSIRQRPASRPIRLNVGITDSVPKLIVRQILEPALHFRQAIHLVCREGSIDRLLLEMVGYRLDLVLADEPASRSLSIKTFTHPLGKSGSAFCAVPRLAARLRKDFPRSLDGAPAVLPTETTAYRMAQQKWFDSVGVRPLIIAEIEDSALMKVMAAEGLGFIVVPSVIAAEVMKRYGLKLIARIDECTHHFYAITAERQMKHPAVTAITEHSRSDLFA